MFLPIFLLATWLSTITATQVVVPDGLESKTNVKVTREANVAFRPQLKKLERAPLTSLHTLVVEISPKNKETLDDILYDVSDPFSANYGKHWTYEMLKAHTFNQEGHQFLTSFFTLNGVTIERGTANGDYLFVTASMQYWEELLKAEFYSYCMTEKSGACEGRTFYRSKQYSLPEYLADHVSAVFNIIDFPMKTRSSPQTMSHTPTLNHLDHGRRLQEYVTGSVYPQMFSSYYNIQNNIVGTDGGVTQAIFASINQSTSPSDLSYFQESFGLAQYGLAGDVGGHVFDSACVYEDGENCGEANLDVQWILAVAQQTPTTYYYWDDTLYSSDDFWVSWITAIASMEDPDDVYSVSYGQVELGVDQSVMNSFNYQAQKLGILGTTVLVSSGDNGIQSTIDEGNYTCVGYFSEFPTSSQYVTSVGATMGPERGQPEVACQNTNGTYPIVALITTGGGFSVFNSRPYWQDSAVSGYFQNVSSQPVQSTDLPYNTQGRGYPDVSLMGHNYLVVMNQNFTLVDGTSASSPAMAGIVTLANYNRVRAGKPVLGFINPFLYAYRSSFARDITVGDNSCYGFDFDLNTGNVTAKCCPQYGFLTSSGWDPVTGIGSVDANAFITAAFDAVTETATAEPGFEPTFEPTMEYSTEPTMETSEPTEEPTLFPYAYNGSVRIVFSVAQVFGGVSEFTYDQQYELNTMVVIDTVAACMNGIYPSNITDYSIAGIDSSTIAAYYLVLCNRTDTSYDVLSNQLKTCVQSGQFNSMLNMNSVNAGASGLNTAYSIFVDTEVINNNVPTAMPTGAPLSFAPNTDFSLEPTMEFSGEPSEEPSWSPYTMYPTWGIPQNYSNIRVIFAAAQLLQGISNVTYDAQYDLNTMVMKQSIAAVMTGIYPNNITEYSISSADDFNSNSVQGLVQNIQVVHRALQSSQDMIIAQYLVLDNNTDANYFTLSDQLYSSVSNGGFDKILQANAAAAGATSLTSVSCTYVTTEEIVNNVPTGAPTYSVRPTLISEMPTFVQTAEPSLLPSEVPTVLPTIVPSEAPTAIPTNAPSLSPDAVSQLPTAAPSLMPSEVPSAVPSIVPSETPTEVPTTTAPSIVPTATPTATPTDAPTAVPTVTPTTVPSAVPTTMPTATPTDLPTFAPTAIPSEIPTATPSFRPSTTTPTTSPTEAPTAIPSFMPSAVPTAVPTSAAPSEMPTFRPTLAPSVSPAPTATIAVQFAASQTINGISYSTYSTDPSLYNGVLQQTIADCMTGINPQDVTNLVVNSPPSRRLTAKDIKVEVQLRSIVAEETDANGHRRLQSNAIATSYVVSSSDPTLTYDSLSQQLTTAVNSGTFNTLLSTNAETAGATALVGCESSPVTTVQVTDSSSSDKGLSGGAIAGIVIGVLVGVGLIVAGVVYVVFYMNKDPASGGVVTSSASGGKTAIATSQGVDRMYDNPLAHKSLASPANKGKRNNDNDLL